MSKAMQILMNEHRMIETVMGSLETLVVRLEGGEGIPREHIGNFVDFFKNFADKCHHGKEEDLLFRTLENYGFSPDAGPVGVMLSEHARGRTHLQALAAIGTGSGPLSPDELRTVVQHARGYIDLLLGHIAKEDCILFPMAERSMPTRELDRLEESFIAFEENVMGAGVHEGFHRLAETLTAQYPPARLAAPMMPCSHH